MRSIGSRIPDRWRGWLTASLVTAGFACLGFTLFDLGASAKALAGVPPKAWISVIGLSLLVAFLRAARVAVIADTVPAGIAVRASFWHGAANVILPARMGEAVLPITLARYGGMDAMRAVGLLLIVRLGDLIALIGLGSVLIAGLDFWGFSTELRLLLAAGGVLLIACIGGVPFLVRIAGRCAPRAISVYANRIAEAGAQLTYGSRIGLLALTLAIWVTLGIAAQVSIGATGLRVDPMLAWLASVAASFAFALPTNGIASIGPFEAAFVGVLVAADGLGEAALAAAVHLHMCALIAGGLPALATLVFPKRSRDQKSCP